MKNVEKLVRKRAASISDAYIARMSEIDPDEYVAAVIAASETRLQRSVTIAELRQLATRQRTIAEAIEGIVTQRLGDITIEMHSA